MCVRFALSNTRLKMYGKGKKVRIVGVHLFIDYKITVNHTQMPCIPNKWQNPKLTSDTKNTYVG